jgi:hypothetical protein
MLGSIENIFVSLLANSGNTRWKDPQTFAYKISENKLQGKKAFVFKGLLTGTTSVKTVLL